ncbi:MAG TPA: NAD(P)-dependent oxidoreductase [Candidatus Hydrogenedens sp.]|nr:NAD(P)-dependent oxidoreductase [Candidatus Hydrogenedens sp.]HOL21046.1 NAD(P)-dependent oxidoreductase [Candidatus Hydrogenedens sp.]HPP58845.1 NAD(P)-dependent oxidoreductase [Candidatus Hydrogenedens sp.]
MKLLITGGSGFVAGSILRQIPNDIETYALSRQDKPEALPEYIRWMKVTTNDKDAWANIVLEIQPNVIIHTSAMADIDECEKQPNLAWEVNVGLTRALLKSAEQLSSRFIYCSTDTVFDGKKGMYTENDTPSPLNHYAKTKVQAEYDVSQAKISCVIARLSLVMGFPILGVGNSFLARMQKKIAEGKPIPMPKDEFRTPIDVITVGKALIELAQNTFEGVIHLAGNERSSRYDMAKIIAREMNWDETLIHPHIITDSLRAPRPKDASLSNALAKSVLKTPFCGIADGMRLVKTFITKG